MPANSPDVFRAVLCAPVSRAKKLASSTKKRLAHPAPGILTNDKERHVAIYVLGAALVVWLVAAVAGAAAGDGGACVTVGKGSSSSFSSLSAAASCVRGGKLPLLWFDAVLRRAGPLLPVPLLLSRAAVSHAPLFGGSGASAGAGSAGRGLRPAAHFVHVAAVYAAAAAARLAVYLPHRTGVLGRVVAFPSELFSAALARVGGGGATVSPQGLRARVAAVASRAAAVAAAPLASLFSSSSSSSSSSSTKDSNVHHLMSDHLFLGACVGAVLCAEGVLLLSDARRHSGSSNRTRGRVLGAGAALCAFLYLALCLDMAFTVAYFHARRESAAAVVAGLVAFQGPLAVWLLGGVSGARRAFAGAVGSSSKAFSTTKAFPTSSTAARKSTTGRGRSSSSRR